MPVTAEEVQEAEAEGVKVDLLVSPLRVMGNKEGQVVGLECIRNRLIEPDDGGRPRPVPIQGSEFVIEVDTVLPAVSQSPDTSFLPDILARSKWDLVEVEPKSLMTNVKGVFAVGDYTTGPRDVISVIADAHRASAAIHGYLQGTLRGEKGRCFKQAEWTIQQTATSMNCPAKRCRSYQQRSAARSKRRSSSASARKRP